MNGQKTIIFLYLAVLFQTVLTIKKSRLKTSARTEPNDPDERRIYNLMTQALGPCWTWPFNSGKYPPFEVFVQFYTREKQKKYTMDRIQIPLTEGNDLFVNQIAPVIRQKQETDQTIVLIIHGFLQDGSERWIRYLREGLHDMRDFTIGIVNWGSRAIACTYSDAAYSARAVAKEMINMLKFMRSHGIDTSKIYMIGHGIGAHIAGQIGKNLPSTEPKIYRITGLDPSSTKIGTDPPSKDFPPNLRLARTDAQYVDVIHTSQKIGMPDERLGHVDFMMYPALIQSECSYEPSFWEKSRVYLNFHFSWKDLCAHQNAYHYFYEAVTNWSCKMVGSKEMARAHRTRTKDFDPNQDTVLGLYTFKYPQNGTLYAYVNEFSPYCRLDD